MSSEDKKGLIYFQDGEVVAEYGNVKVYKMNGELFLEIGPSHTLWALESDLTDYIEQLYDYPHGRCLEIGLGLGVASRYILTFPKVEHLTTVEKNLDVIKAHSLIKESDRGSAMIYNPSKHKVLHADGLMYAYQTKSRYDFIFIDSSAGYPPGGDGIFRNKAIEFIESQQMVHNKTIIMIHDWHHRSGKSSRKYLENNNYKLIRSFSDRTGVGAYQK